MEAPFIEIKEAYESLIKDDSLAYWYFPLHNACTLVSGPSNVRPRSTDAELAIIPGRFNPLLEIHRKIYNNTDIALTAFEMSITRFARYIPVPNHYYEVAAKLTQFRPEELVVLTNAPTFAHKLALFRSYTVAIHTGAVPLLELANQCGPFSIGGLQGNFIVYDQNGYSFPFDWKRKPPNVHRAHNQFPEEE